MKNKPAIIVCAFTKMHCACVHEEGTSLPELALVLPILALLIVILVDIGQAYYYALGTSSAAHAAALYGVQNTNDVSGIVTAAAANAPDIKSLSTNVTYGCECYDGSSAVVNCTTPPACSDNYVNYVNVTTSATFTPILPYPDMPNSFTLTGNARLRSGGD